MVFETSAPNDPPNQLEHFVGGGAQHMFPYQKKNEISKSKNKRQEKKKSFKRTLSGYSKEILHDPLFEDCHKKNLGEVAF